MKITVQKNYVLILKKSGIDLLKFIFLIKKFKTNKVTTVKYQMVFQISDEIQFKNVYNNIIYIY